MTTDFAGDLRIGSEAHKRLFCHDFLDSFTSLEPGEIRWPSLDPASLARLRALPVWDEALNTERTAAARVRMMAEAEQDGIIREAIAMQAYEETRHAKMLESLMQHCGIEMHEGRGEKPREAEWGFMRMGYGEVFDTFFAFGLFRIAADTGFFPAEIFGIVESMMQEEARHIVFFANWVAYRGRTLPLRLRPRFTLWRVLAVSRQAVGRMHTALQITRGKGPGEDFVMQVPEALDNGVNLGSFLETCVTEHEHRMATSDARLLTPKMMPRLAGVALRLMGMPKRRN